MRKSIVVGYVLEIIALVIFAISSITFVSIAATQNYHTWIVLLKALPFVCLIYLNAAHTTHILIIVGLITSFTADVSLYISNDTVFFVTGVVMFLLTHVCNITFFVY